jgi:putative Ca2+/H+ antiporter (TMEM165/GDT1 family)
MHTSYSLNGQSGPIPNSSLCLQILATEIGDETFIVAALMAMRYPKAIVFGGAISALVIMTIISTALGFVVPSLISKRATGIGAGILYTFFGLRLLYIAYSLKPSETCEVCFRSCDLSRGISSVQFGRVTVSN